MGKGVPLRPSYTANIATLIENDIPVRAICTTCHAFQDIDLQALALKIGGDYDLWGKRTRCRITEGCTGWNRFFFDGRGRFDRMGG